MAGASRTSVGELRTRDSASFERAISTQIAPIRFVSSGSGFFGKFRWVRQQGLHIGRTTNGEVRANSLGETGREPSRFVFCVQVSGRGTIEQAGRRAEIGSGQVSLYRSDSPHELVFPAAGERVGIAIPAPMLGVPARALDRLTGTRLDVSDPLLATVARSIIAYEGALYAVPEERRGHVIDLIVGGLRAVVASLDGSDRPDPRDELFRRAAEYIEEHLDDPGLDPRLVAEALFVSTRTLQQAFTGSGTGVAQLIRERRLERASRDLADPALSHVPISDIARRWCFDSASHFARLMRLRFGASPRMLRAGGPGRG